MPSALPTSHLHRTSWICRDRIATHSVEVGLWFEAAEATYTKQPFWVTAKIFCCKEKINFAVSNKSRIFAVDFKRKSRSVYAHNLLMGT